MILAGDVGGTNTRLAVFDAEDERLMPLVVNVFPSRMHKSLDEIVGKFMAANSYPVDHACFGVAGPVKLGRSETPNLPWVVLAHRLADELGLKTVHLINDLEANAYGIAALEPNDIVVLNEGEPDARGNAALISAGTGLGEAGLHWKGDRHQPFPSEGGHADFAPRNPVEVELLLYLLSRFEHVSYERVVSGPGLYNIYKFLQDTGRGVEPAWLAERLREEDPPTVISSVAAEGRCELCVKALDQFVSVYGAEAGNLALKILATGGVFVGGGIAPKIVPQLKDPAFMEAFTAKGRMKPLLEAMPVRVILNDKTALLGAARFTALKGSLLN
ncbi:MAG: glucokinase [Nitrospinota bacterium]